MGVRNDTMTDSSTSEQIVSEQWAEWFSRYGTILAFCVIFIGFSMFSENFLTFSNQFNVMTQISMLMIVALGETIAVASGEFDLSVGQVSSFAGMLVAGMFVWHNQGVIVALGASMAAGAAIGLFNGFLVTKARIPSLIATLGMGPIALGINYAYTGGSSIYGVMPETFYHLGSGHLYEVIPIPALIMLGVIVLAYLFLHRSRIGRYIIATGSNINAARLAGIHVDRYRLIALMLSGVTAALGGALLTARLGTGQPEAGTGFLMDSLAAVFLGMTTIRPGQATVLGTVVGVVIIGTLNNGLNLLGAPFYMQNIIRGGVMILAVSLAAYRGEIRFF